ncbi:hypothetical protein ACJW31_03G155900 [Castanea mollissima]
MSTHLWNCLPPVDPTHSISLPYYTTAASASQRLLTIYPSPLSSARQWPPHYSNPYEFCRFQAPPRPPPLYPIFCNSFIPIPLVRFSNSPPTLAKPKPPSSSLALLPLDFSFSLILFKAPSLIIFPNTVGKKSSSSSSVNPRPAEPPLLSIFWVPVEMKFTGLAFL